MAVNHTRTLNGALAGALAAAVWAAQQPLDKRILGSDYDDVELLGKAVTRGDSWFAAGLALHISNGALFGAIYANVAPLLPIPPRTRAIAVAMLEHIGTWPLSRVSDHVHPARDDMPRLSGNARAFAQATWRHALFGFLLGELERRLNAEPEVELPDYSDVASSNGHGSLEHAVSAGPA